MANHALTYNNLNVNGGVADPAGVAFAATDTGSIAAAAPERTLLRVACGATGGNFVLDAGDYPPALAAGQGPLTVAMTANTTYWVGPIESGRFLQSDGSLTFSTAQGATVTAFKVARH